MKRNIVHFSLFILFKSTYLYSTCSVIEIGPTADVPSDFGGGEEMLASDVPELVIRTGDADVTPSADSPSMIGGKGEGDRFASDASERSFEITFYLISLFKIFSIPSIGLN